MSAPAVVGAAVDLGSTSVHLLVAEVVGHDLHPLVDQSAFLGLGGTIDHQAHLGAASRAALVETLTTYVATARQLGAVTIGLVGTEPLRRASDAPRIVAEVEAATSAPLHVLTHEEEALLTLVGVTGGRTVREETLVLDIGGGSSEFVTVAPGRAPRAGGVRIGSARLLLASGSGDPPEPEALDRMRQLARAALRDAVDADPAHVVAVGGTATNILKVTEAGIADRRVDRRRLAAALATLAAAPADDIVQRFGVKPTRARLLAAGCVIVEAVLDRYGIDGLEVADAGIREGVVLVGEHSGRAWRDRLPELAHGWRG